MENEEATTNHAWNIGRLTGNYTVYSEPFELKEKPDAKFALFIKNNTGNYYGFPFGIQLMSLTGLSMVDVYAKIWVQCGAAKGEDRIGKFSDTF